MWFAFEQYSAGTLDVIVASRATRDHDSARRKYTLSDSYLNANVLRNY